LLYEVGASGDVPPGNCVVKCQTCLRRRHTEMPDRAGVLGKVLEEFMEVERSFQAQGRKEGRRKIVGVLGRFGLSYHTGGIVLGAAAALPTKSLNEMLKERDLSGVDKEFERARANVEKDPPAAITAACSNLDALFKVYIEDIGSGVEVPTAPSPRPLWKAVSKHIGLDPAAIEDDDVKKILSGRNSVAESIGSLRTQAGSVHGRGRHKYLLQARDVQARHARLAIHGPHTLVGFFIETWDERERKQARDGCSSPQKI